VTDDTDHCVECGAVRTDGTSYEAALRPHGPLRSGGPLALSLSLIVYTGRGSAQWLRTLTGVGRQTCHSHLSSSLKAADALGQHRSAPPVVPICARDHSSVSCPCRPRPCNRRPAPRRSPLLDEPLLRGHPLRMATLSPHCVRQRRRVGQRCRVSFRAAASIGAALSFRAAKLHNITRHAPPSPPIAVRHAPRLADHFEDAPRLADHFEDAPRLADHFEDAPRLADHFEDHFEDQSSGR